MPINSRDKGARFELELAARLREYGYDARRTAQHCGKSGDAADIMGLPGLHIEAKHAEQMRLYEWLEQAKRDAAAGGAGRMPAVFHRRNRSEILVTMELPEFMRLYGAWAGAQEREV